MSADSRIEPRMAVRFCHLDIYRLMFCVSKTLHLLLAAYCAEFPSQGPGMGANPMERRYNSLLTFSKRVGPGSDCSRGRFGVVMQHICTIDFDF